MNGLKTDMPVSEVWKEKSGIISTGFGNPVLIYDEKKPSITDVHPACRVARADVMETIE